MLWRTSFALLTVLLAGACGERGQNAMQEPMPTRLVHHPLTGVSFEVPVAWTQRLEGEALIFAMEGEVRTITLQATGLEASGPFAVLDAMVGALVAAPRFEWLRREPAMADGEPAVRYDFLVELHESLRRRHGLLMAAGPYWVDLAYAAPPRAFVDGAPVFEETLRSLHIEPPTSR